ncbi:MAG: hypothetical protein QOJ29_3666 [Thermoleophilaceae bacterium]|jgi:hypothetical protein|nr:hypothetical protein [Thermoleophilaceae bacterium]
MAEPVRGERALPEEALRDRYWLRFPDSRWRSMRAVVYFVAAGDDGPIKVGFTRGVLSRRLADLQVVSPVRLRALYAIHGGRDRERRIHVELHEHRLHGEWFEREPVLRYLDRYIKQDFKLRAIPGGKR